MFPYVQPCPTYNLCVYYSPKSCITVFPAYSDTLGTWEKCHCNQIVTVTIGSLVTNQSFGTCQKCHCKRGVTLTSVTVSGEVCTDIQRSPLTLSLHYKRHFYKRQIRSLGDNSEKSRDMTLPEHCLLPFCLQFWRESKILSFIARVTTLQI